jgi:hypothetical protein
VNRRLNYDGLSALPAWPAASPLVSSAPARRPRRILNFPHTRQIGRKYSLLFRHHVANHFPHLWERHSPEHIRAIPKRAQRDQFWKIGKFIATLPVYNIGGQRRRVDQQRRQLLRAKECENSPLHISAQRHHQIASRHASNVSIKACKMFNHVMLKVFISIRTNGSDLLTYLGDRNPAFGI